MFDYQRVRRKMWVDMNQFHPLEKNSNITTLESFHWSNSLESSQYYTGIGEDPIPSTG
jgi:hypothetical protein